MERKNTLQDRELKERISDALNLYRKAMGWTVREMAENLELDALSLQQMIYMKKAPFSVYFKTWMMLQDIVEGTKNVVEFADFVDAVESIKVDFYA